MKGAEQEINCPTNDRNLLSNVSWPIKCARVPNYYYELIVRKSAILGTKKQGVLSRRLHD